VLEYLRENGAINNTEYRELPNVGLLRACYLLRRMARLGLVQRQFTGKRTEYRLAEQGFWSNPG
jgi:hypothetical protein